MAASLLQNDQLRMIISPESVQRNDVVHAIQINGRIIFASVGLDEGMAAKMIGDLGQFEGQPLGDGGDLYIRGEGNHQCLKLAASAATPEFVYYFTTAFQPSAHIIRDLHSGFRDVATI